MCSSTVERMAKRRVKAGDQSIAVAYMRVSTDDQRLGLGAQREAITVWAARERRVVVSWHFDEGVSGASTIEERPGLLKAIDAVRIHRAGAFVVAKRDRVARDTLVALTIEKALLAEGARLLSADGVGNGEDPADQLLKGVVSSMSEYERALIRSRTVAALARKKQAGGRTGSCPFGFRDDGTSHLVKDAEEQRTIALALKLRGEGMTERAIAHELTSVGRTSRSGKPLGQVQVHRILAAAAAPVPTVRAKSIADHLDPELLFYKGTQAVTLGWVRKQVRLLERRGLSREKAVEALVKVGVTKDGRPIESADV